jgi:hypothetical protein
MSVQQVTTRIHDTRVPAGLELTGPELGDSGMSQSVSSGFPMVPGDHICALYSGPEELEATLGPYLAAGLVAGDKCVCIVEADERTALLAEVGRHVDLDAFVASGQLELFTAAESYLRRGVFSADEMLEFWTDSLDRSLHHDGFVFARSSGDTSGLSHLVDDFDEFAVYESHLNRLAAEYPQTVLCLYDLAIVGGGMMLDLLRTHPKLLLGGMVIENPHYLTPDEYLTLKQHSDRTR